MKSNVSASGQGTLKYQWYFKNAGDSNFRKSSITGSTYSVKMTPTINGRKIYCVISDAYGQSVKTKTVTLKMTDTLGIYSQPTSDKAAIGDKVSATVKANGTGKLKYQWYIKNAGSSKFVKSSFTKATYSVPMTKKVDGRRAYCIVTDATGAQVKSHTITFRSAK